MVQQINLKNENPATVSVRERLCMESKPENCGVIIFGASGDLAHRKIIPSFFSMYIKKLLPNGFYLLGCGRTSLTDDSFREGIKSSLQKAGIDTSLKSVEEFLSFCFYSKGDYFSQDLYENIKNKLQKFDEQFRKRPKKSRYRKTSWE